MDNRIGAAFDIAQLKHRGQTDKAGQPYILHLVRVMEGCDGAIAKTVALLHDIVEDTDVTIEWITDFFGKDVGCAVDAITKRKGEKYDNYLDRVAANPIATVVKISDLADNMIADRLLKLPKTDQERLLEKYGSAFVRLSKSL